MIGCDLRDAAIGTWHEGRRNVWRRVDFARADLRGALALGCLLEECSFVGAQLRDAQFQQTSMSRCRFSGALENVLFDGRELPDRPHPGALTGVDFGTASFADVEFRGCHFDDVKLPPGIVEIADYPRVARRALRMLEAEQTTEARMLKSELQTSLKLPGADSSVGVFNRADYVASGGDSLADLAERVMLGAED